jgi:SAM-dependent methyltransferase
MQHRDDEVYSSPPMLRLLDEQSQALKPGLRRCVGTHGLLLDASPRYPRPALPLLGCWTSLAVSDGGYDGDLRARADEPLPFVDDAFELVLVRQALERASHPAALLDELIRVLAPGGTLALTGVHPLGCWSAWLHWRARGSSLALQMPWRLRHRLEREGLLVERVLRIGSVWPGTAVARRSPASVFGGGYLLLARKQRRPVTLLRSRPQQMRVPASGQLSPAARRGASLQIFSGTAKDDE